MGGSVTRLLAMTLYGMASSLAIYIEVTAAVTMIEDSMWKELAWYQNLKSAGFSRKGGIWWSWGVGAGQRRSTIRKPGWRFWVSKEKA
eukprot:8771263-Karenia_brevis.AAC.1